MSAFRNNFAVRAFSPSLIARGLTSFDRATGFLVVLCWIAAFAMLIMADIAVHRAASLAETKTGGAQVVASAMSPDEIQPVFERLRQRFPALKIRLEDGQKLEIWSNDGSSFQQWIAAIQAVETFAPQFYWSFEAFCVGQCADRGLMSAAIVGQKKEFSTATP